ncbi:Di-N-acetylchitobiase, putative [Plasmopara halstedii]|uniref:Di-N-acetylchitobiase, putative n=1 Tax=Plasmopara halstedii TaxID=4781 RepID=A0A0P1AV71_PLAHL|nr:Di-N-acetylchitobiase, putative [Plasmopara halstedii]CEG46320.1 Di-N-acetylchitobiase, putative [Plasmopara halstedii]|eukprot:XP_024582689.1 Di-N-acetylchitobiase, putative [Plasmopara halstedii]
MQWPLLVVAVGSLVTPKGAVRSIPIHYTKNLSTEFLAQEERVYLDKCPCNDSGYVSKSLCLPVDFAGKKPRKEVFAFSVATNDSWKHYDWDQLTTVAWNEDKNLLCHAHSKGVKVVVKHNFDDMNQLCNISARQEWVQATYYKIVKNYADGVNIDTEKPSQGATSHCLGLLVNELRQELKKHALTKNAQITFDVPWAPRGVDGRYYPWRDLATAVDFLFVMSYDMRSQVFDTCVGGANSPLALVKQGLQEFILAYDIVPNKLVLGVPWYGYQYSCIHKQQSAASNYDALCQIQQIPFLGAPCSDAAGEQIDYGNIRRLIKENGLVEQWDMMTLSPFVWLSTQEGGQSQIWFDNPRSLEEKYSIVRDLGLRGVGMWNADSLDYSAADDSKAMWSSLAAAFKA